MTGSTLGGRARPFWIALVILAALSVAEPMIGAAGAQPNPSPPAPPPPGVAAPPEVVQQLQAALDEANRRFQARDAGGVLSHVSDQYRTGPFTKAALREQLNVLYSVYDAVRAQVRIDEVRIVGPHAWVYSTGEISGRLAVVNRWVSFLSWQRELEVARLENGAWRLYGYQQ